MANLIACELRRGDFFLVANDSPVCGDISLNLNDNEKGICLIFEKEDNGKHIVITYMLNKKIRTSWWSPEEMFAISIEKIST